MGMRWAEGLIAVDWGTTNRRAWRLGPDGRVAGEMEDGEGILAVGPGGFHAAAAEIRARLGDLPLLMAGMVGSNRGWVEAPYVPCPAGLPELAAKLRWIEGERAAIVPGVAFDSGGAADVMRGEEMQLLGAHAEGWIGADSTLCHPGTHNKWVRLEKGRIAAFRTVMTGEMFNLLKTHSILSDLLAGPVEPGPAFEAGVAHGLERDDLTAELFSVRARTLLGRSPRDEAAAYVSGLLIGADLRVGLRFAGAGEIVAMGRPDLTRLFAAALAVVGRPPRIVDGEAAFLAGARQLAELVR
ncbi:MAG TPA: 2-dehydro-3-deoxygalactonokinase [Allosphingosinicella sp.]|nr:2-dehydro-3-deoxygalactonokinase [Allosphingosinicella sp.]